MSLNEGTSSSPSEQLNTPLSGLMSGLQGTETSDLLLMHVHYQIIQYTLHTCFAHSVNTAPASITLTGPSVTTS